ncbi:phosphate ABC transporter permease subunit PstC [Natranaerobius thermophilus]|uniref:Phosphate transport system permease protein n=1 Tax=Natranaerobius thermophilus (strain ATCC BAA-1301 / DSM 18059 / JW/NM-WN-LF) TaxID=457570 RepID=B2A0K3_NATTJ|nr:phosphate ABC transporter permease subunit PstC [Natranaerobius thermophilus]ACB84564.1 phosphate ABC transporter, inner membrane subunit PstC [Natranaerobius thermophilus JW/NM-WN-LF]
MKAGKWFDVKQKLIKGYFTLTGGIAILVLFLIFAFLIVEAYPAVKELGILEFLTGYRWMPSSGDPGYGTLALILSTLIIAIGSIVIAVPWGVITAGYISDVASPKIKEIMKITVETLAIFPSVVLGFIGLTILAPLVANIFQLSNGLTALTGVLMLSIMALPTIISISEDALNSVPNEYKEASYALGATKWETLRRITYPSASSGIIAAVMLGFGRAIGETMTVLMVTGNSLAVPLTEIWGFPIPDFLTSVRTLTATIAIEASDVPWGSLHYHSLFVVGAILFLMTFIVNLIADFALGRSGEE